MRAFGVVIRQPFPDPGAGLRARFKCVQVDAFIFQGPPQPLDHPVVRCPAVDCEAINERGPATLTIHGDLHPRIFQRPRPFEAGELAVPLPGSGLLANHERDDRCP